MPVSSVEWEGIDKDLSRRLNVWISHSAEDQEFVDELRMRLQKDGLHVYTAHDILSAGDSIMPQVARAILEADVGLFVISKASAQSTWFEAELAFCADEAKKNNKPVIIPIVVDKDAPLSPLLSTLVFVDASNPTRFEQGYEFLRRSLASVARKRNSPPDMDLLLSKQFLLAQKHSLEFKEALFENNIRYAERGLKTSMVTASTAFLIGIVVSLGHWLATNDLDVTQNIRRNVSSESAEVLRLIIPVLAGVLFGFFFGRSERNISRRSDPAQSITTSQEVKE